MTIVERAQEYVKSRLFPKSLQETAMACYTQGAKEQQDVLIKKVKEYLSMEPYGVTDMCSDFEEDLIKYLEDEQ